jgi:hypothetical protein
MSKLLADDDDATLAVLPFFLSAAFGASRSIISLFLGFMSMLLDDDESQAAAAAAAAAALSLADSSFFAIAADS